VTQGSYADSFIFTTPLRFDPEVIEGRRALLEQYANAVMGTPALAKSAVMQTFLASGVLPDTDTSASNTPSLAQSHSPAADRPASGSNVSSQGKTEVDILARNADGAGRRALSLGVGDDHRREEAAAAARKSYASACDA
jgi:hypothetical protein